MERAEQLKVIHFCHSALTYYFSFMYRKFG